MDWLIPENLKDLFSALFFLIYVYFLVKHFYLDRKRKKHIKQNECLTCGYDMNGAIDNVCPECGTKESMNQNAPFHQKTNSTEAFQTILSQKFEENESIDGIRFWLLYELCHHQNNQDLLNYFHLIPKVHADWVIEYLSQFQEKKIWHAYEFPRQFQNNRVQRVFVAKFRSLAETLESQMST